MSISLSIRLPDKTARALEKLSKMTAMPKKYFIEKALESYLAEYADYQIALDRLRDQDDPAISPAVMKRRISRRPPTA